MQGGVPSSANNNNTIWEPQDDERNNQGLRSKAQALYNGIVNDADKMTDAGALQLIELAYKRNDIDEKEKQTIKDYLGL